MKKLPLNSEAFYEEAFLEKAESALLLKEIVTGFDVTNKVIKMADGTERIAGNGTYLFMDADLTSYEHFHEVWGPRSAWTDSLALIRNRIAGVTGVQFPVARCVYYQDGSESMGFHRDLPAYGSTDVIASLSLGAEREFVFREIDNPDRQYAIRLASGSLLIMGKGCQELYEHGVPVDKDCSQPRLNISFRKYHRK